MQLLLASLQLALLKYTDKIPAHLLPCMGEWLSLLTMVPCEVIRAVDQSHLFKTHYYSLFQGSSKIHGIKQLLSSGVCFRSGFRGFRPSVMERAHPVHRQQSCEATHFNALAIRAPKDPLSYEPFKGSLTSQTQLPKGTKDVNTWDSTGHVTFNPWHRPFTLSSN